MKSLKILLHSNYTYFIIIIFTILYLVITTMIVNYNSSYTGNEKKFLMDIQKIDIDGNVVNLVLFGKERVQGKYYFKTEEEKKYFFNNYLLGDKVSIVGSLVKPSSNTNPNMFSYKKYLYRNRQFFNLSIEKIDKIKSSNNILYNIKNYVVNRIKGLERSGGYISTFILADDNGIDPSIRDSYSSIGVSHLLSMANMHISIVSLMAVALFKKNKLILDIFLILFSFFILFLMDFSASAIRTVVFFVFLKLNKIFKVNLNEIKVLFLSLFLIIIINPFIVYNIGFLYSSVISCFLLVFREKIDKRKSYIGKLLMVSYISFLVGLPITIYNFYEINFLSIINNLLFVPIITFVLFPLSIITFLFPILDGLMGSIVSLIEALAKLLDISILSFSFIKLNIIVYFLYYVLIVLVLKKPNSLVLLMLLLLIHCNYNYIFRSSYMLVIDVGQGDSIFFQSNGRSMLIDTGGLVRYDKEKWMVRSNYYSISEDTLIPLLKSLGIRNIDYLVLTHGDYDHVGEAINIMKKIRVKNVVFNNGGFNDIEKRIASVSNNNIIAKTGNRYFIGDFVFKSYIFPSDDENDNSIILLSEIDEFKILLMGDSSVTTEKSFLNNYNIPSVDFVKIGHHGSRTSTSEYLMKEIKPKVALISAGRNNIFNHPHPDILDRLEKYKVRTYTTKVDGAILINFSKRVTISTYQP